MTLFILTFFLVYGGVHVYAFLKARAALNPRALTAVSLALFMLIMVAAPFIVRLSEKSGHEFTARMFSYIGYTWMGILFLFFSFSLATDLCRVSLYLLKYFVKPGFNFPSLSNQYAFFLPLFLALSIAFYGYFEAWNIRTERLTIKTGKYIGDAKKLRIVQISDVHIGLIVREEKLKRILDEARKAEPDILVSTGDILDGQINSLEGPIKLLGEINPKYGKFAVTGNHEVYAGLRQALDFLKLSGFKTLRGEIFCIPGLINIAGTDDPAGERTGLYKNKKERELLAGLTREKFTLLLKHRPLPDKDSQGLFDLQLSGHVHKGQIFPFSIATWLYYPVNAGLLDLPNNSKMYVSRGAGTWGPPIRFLSPPEVTVIDIVSDKDSL